MSLYLYQFLLIFYYSLDNNDQTKTITDQFDYPNHEE